VHGDLFRDNVLWGDEGELAALLDFESASDGVLAYDLAVTLLAWCFGDTLSSPLARAMVAGYEAERPLAVAERAGMLAEACVAALRFTITRVTDYAMRVVTGPRVLKDYRRFLARLDALEALGPSGLSRALWP
jgi:homoserine kinase type II